VTFFKGIALDVRLWFVDGETSEVLVLTP